VKYTGRGFEEQCPSSFGIDFITPSHLVAAGYHEDRLIHLDLSVGESDTICIGRDGYNDGGIDVCELDSPISVCALPDFIYIGESGTNGGGVRRLSYNTGPNNISMIKSMDLPTPQLPTTTRDKVIVTNTPSWSTDSTRSKPGDYPEVTRPKISSKSTTFVTNSSVVDHFTMNNSSQASVTEDMSIAPTVGECLWLCYTMF